jgi:tetratricopeptide (TPR) repeat protein
MKEMTMKSVRAALATSAVWGTAAVLGSAPAVAQNGLASIHGHVNNPVGQPIKGAIVELSKDLTNPTKDKVWTYKFPVDDSGDYKGTGIQPGTYFLEVRAEDKDADFIESSTFTVGEDKKVDFDMSRKEYLDHMSPEARAQLEEYKKTIASAMSANRVVANLNATLKTVRADMEAAKPTHGDVSKDVADMKTTIDQKPEESILWIVYGDTLQAQGDHLAADDRAAKKSVMSDDEVIKEYTEAADAYQKGVDLNKASKKPTPADAAVAYNSMGNVYGKLGKVTESSAAFENAVQLDPTKAGMYYNNEAAILINNQLNDGALAAAEKAIAADPNRPDPYYIKGKVLIAKSAFDAKTQKLVPPDGCVDAYQHFLSIAPPDDKKIPEVKEILTELGQKVDLKYSAPKKK